MSVNKRKKEERSKRGGSRRKKKSWNWHKDDQAAIEEKEGLDPYNDIVCIPIPFPFPVAARYSSSLGRINRYPVADTARSRGA